MATTAFGGDASAALQAGRRRLGLSYEQLWVQYFALGGNHPPVVLESWLRGAGPASAHEYDLIAHALNERSADRGFVDPLPYSADL